ncbi:hypothetical protein [Oceanobacillus sp. FSL K6-0251]|uniref:hypothetical protein n=1 Tax=Oceanobacillus sp. FSL K6-0251 TaxID=2921602 RepID=UPI0030FA1A9F
MNTIVDVENWMKFEEELVELNAFHLNEGVRTEAIERANGGENENFYVVAFDERKEQQYWFHFSFWDSEDYEEEKILQYDGYTTDE